MFGFCGRPPKWFSQTIRSNARRERKIGRAALAVSYVLSMVICSAMPSLARSGLPDRTEDRLVTGVVKLLSAPIDLSPSVLGALAAKHAEVLEPGDDFWPKTVDTIMSRKEVQAALEKRVRSNFSDNRDLYARLTKELPTLADALAKTLAFDDRGMVDGRPIDEVLRRMQTAPPTAQRALIARAIDPSNGTSDELVERIASFPEILAATENYVLGLRSASNPKARILAFRYAVARGLEVTNAELSEALGSSDQGGLRAALARISSLPFERAAAFAPALTRIVEQAGEPGIWDESLRLLLVVVPDTATALIERHRADESFWISDSGYAALSAMAAVPGSLAILRARIADLPLQKMLASGRCDVLAPAAAIWPNANAADAATILTSLLSNLARSQNGPPCSAETIGKSLDAATSRLGTAAAHAYATALARQANSANASPDEPGTGTETVRNILQAAQATRRAFASDPGTLVDLARRDNLEPLVAALIEALPSDDPMLSQLRLVFRPDDKESLTDHIQRNKKAILTVLRLTARPNGWTDRDMGQLVSLSSSAADLDVARSAFDVLMLTDHVQGLVDTFDATSRLRIEPSDAPDEPTAKALRAFTRASTLSNDRASLFSQERVGWLLDRFSIEGLRGRGVRALGPRPNSMSIDPDRFANSLMRALPSKHGSTTGVCADAATLGPFSDDRLAIRSLELSTAESYQNEDWAPACVAWLAPSKSAVLTEQGDMLWLLSLRDGTLATQDEPSKQLKTLFELWSKSKSDALGDLLRRKMASRATALAPHAGWNLADTKQLWEWDTELSRLLPDQVWPIRRTWLVRVGFLLLLAIPAIVIVHLTFWGILLVAYRRSKRVRTHVFYNPLARKSLGLGYVDILLVWIGPLRRLLFAPFADGMLGELGRVSLGTKEGPYYPSSHVIKLNLSDVVVDLKEAETAALSGRLKIAPEPIVSGLAAWKGPTCLFGPSGRGKTSYLRHVLATNAATRTPFAYLRASECGEDLASTVCDRFPGLGRDTDLILSLIQSGLLDIYVDGLNEVDRALQEKIVQFIVGHPTANIFVTSQEVGISLPRKLATYYLLPLTKNQMREFLVGREPTLDAKAPIRSENYTRSIDIFLDRLSEEVVGSPQGGTATSPDRAILTSFIATLANPMDLDTAAVLLSLDIDPDPFRLREQQFRLVDEDCQADLRRPFPISAFSRSALEARENGKPEIDTTAFGEYVAIMEERKQVRRISLKTAGGYVAEYDFRHEKVSDFYLHFALLEADSTKRFELAGNDRFAGLYDYLARELPLDAANELKEYLLSAALDSNDHRLSDRFLQHLRWRALFGRDDPPWLERYDTPESYTAVEEFDRLAALRDGTEAEMRAARSIIEASRARSRILAAKDARSLESAVRDLFVKKGAHEIPTPGGAASLFEIPGFGSLALLCAAGQRALSAVTRGGLISRASRIAERKLVVVNPQPELDPMDRDWSQVEEWARTLTTVDVRVLETWVLFRLAREEGSFADRSFWPKVMQSANPKNDALGHRLIMAQPDAY
ncbi:hypothetical protein [Methylocella tundrae]|nr:hypothetical protein [Methylocella tundrae]